MSINTQSIRGWSIFVVASAMFFLITAGTFTSLGVALTYMVEEFTWTWAQAGIGFSLLGLLVGLAALAPAWLIRRFGIKATYAAGGAVMVCGFVLLALTNTLTQYFVGTALLGLGFASCAIVPGIYLINLWLAKHQSVAIGGYMTIGGLGGVLGPQLVPWIIAISDSWRMHWWLMAALMLILTLVTVLIVDTPAQSAATGNADPDSGFNSSSNHGAVYRTQQDWQYRDALRTPQYVVIVAALTVTTLCTLTKSNLGFAHMSALGVSTANAADALSLDGLINAFSRAVGGVLAIRIDPKWLLVGALVAEAIGMLALSMADNTLAITLFAVGEGIGFGLCFFATVLLLVNYFGPTDNPQILGMLNFVTTLAFLGPIFGGYIADTFGSFAPVFQGYALLLVIMAIITIAMQPPQPAGK